MQDPWFLKSYVIGGGIDSKETNMLRVSDIKKCYEENKIKQWKRKWPSWEFILQTGELGMSLWRWQHWHWNLMRRKQSWKT